MEYKNFVISNYNDFINKLTIICNHYNAEFKLEKIIITPMIYMLKI